MQVEEMRIVSTGLYEIGDNGLVPVSADGKNDLEIGRVLYFNGYSYDKLVIVKNLGISESFPSYGAKYICVNISNLKQERHDAHSLKFLSEKKDNRIQIYITEEIIPKNEVDTLWAKSEQLKRETEIVKAKEEMEYKALIEKGKELFKRYIPENAKALIVAEYDINDCDYQTDYFNVKTGTTVILGWSTHTKDDFREMRKYADRIPETAHLKTPPIKDESGDEKTENNKSWWHPSDEHREKYSMGRGYYLKAGSGYDSGWKIKKELPYEKDYSEEIYISLARKCIFAQ